MIKKSETFFEEETTNEAIKSLPDDLDLLKNTPVSYDLVSESLEEYLQEDDLLQFEILENANTQEAFLKIPIFHLPNYYSKTLDNLGTVKKLEDENKRLQQELSKQIELVKQTTENMNALLAELEEQKSEIEEKKNHLTRVLQSITQASKIQMALMHSEKDLQDIFPNSFLFIKPKDIVSGDFLWIGRRPGRVFVAVADCTGHGVPGAFMSMMGKLILNQVIIEIGLDDIVAILNAVDAKVNKVLNYSAEGMELGILKFMTDENKIEFAGAHRPLCFTENNEIIEIKGENNGVGGFHKNILKYFKKHELHFRGKGKKRLYLYSDGFPDQIGGDSSRKLTNSKFKKILEDTSKLPIMQQKQELESQLLQWQGRHKQTDDVIVVGIEIE